MNLPKFLSKPSKWITWGQFLVRAVLAAGIAFLLCYFPMENLESYLYDLRIQLQPVSETSGQVEIVTITKQSLKNLGDTPNAQHYAEVIERISAQKPRAIISLVRPDQVPGNQKQIQKLAKITSQTPNFIVLGGSGDYPAPGLEEKLRLPPPFQHIKMGTGSYTYDGKIFAKDSVTRRLLLSHRGRITKLPELINKEFHRENNHHYRGTFDFLFSEQTYIDFRPTGTYQPTAFHQILKENIGTNHFKDKFVVLGLDTEESSNLYSMTPFSRKNIAMSDVEVHANILDTLILDSGRLKPPHWVDLLLTASIAFMTLWIVMAAKPTIGIIALASTLLVFTLFAQLLMSAFGVWLIMIHPYLVIFFCYYFSIPYRLIIENRRSWEYFQKHKLLKQVEELKTNFLSMMSHDLKTPIARIQGMSEILLSEKKRLTQDQTDAIERIKLSAEELSDFISTVLDLGRIENQKVKLKIHSKDINTLLEEVIKKHEFLAKKKNIQIVTDFEPLFSVKIDAELMRQVFANLIENAIKYSPENSKVLVSTDEVDGQIVVQVADQGQGISTEDVDNIFMKFYRSRNARTSTTNGSGLGLYLAKYFVDLHHGKISVESTPDLGSTFTVEMPMETPNPPSSTITH